MAEAQSVPVVQSGHIRAAAQGIPDGALLHHLGGSGVFSGLAGHQPSAEQSQNAGGQKKGQGRARLFVLEDIPNALLRLLGRAGQGSGEGCVRRRGFGHIKHLKLN